MVFLSLSCARLAWCSLHHTHRPISHFNSTILQNVHSTSNLFGMLSPTPSPTPAPCTTPSTQLSAPSFLILQPARFSGSRELSSWLAFPEAGKYTKTLLSAECETFHQDRIPQKDQKHLRRKSYALACAKKTLLLGWRPRRYVRQCRCLYTHSIPLA